MPPPRRDRWGPGTRIPLIAVGPTVKRGYVDHTPYDFGSILRTIEVRFGLEPLDDADPTPTRCATRCGRDLAHSASTRAAAPAQVKCV